MLTAASPAQATASFDELRRREFSRLDAENYVYLDYAGSALYGESQVRSQHEVLRAGLFGNPHAASAASRASIEIIEGARHLVLDWLGVDASTHEVCFTANASAAIKLVAESYPFTPDATLWLAADNHNSVHGMREYARRSGAHVAYLPLDPELRLLDPEGTLEAAGGHGRGLLAFPAQSNFSGVQHPLALVERAHARGLDVLLDIAAFAPSHPISLRECAADFAVLSFYKLFGYPTGLGALVVRREALARLRRPWFAGGSVTSASAESGRHRLRDGASGFEDGTPNFLGIAALPAGFALIDAVGLPRLSRHVVDLTSFFLEEIAALRHGNGVPLVRLYGPRDTQQRGGTVAFNLCDRRGDPYPYTAVEEEARRLGIALRGGCFCNPGASEAAFGLAPPQIGPCLDGLGAEYTPERLATCTGTVVGAVRVSIGLANNREDIRRAIALLASFRDPLHF